MINIQKYNLGLLVVSFIFIVSACRTDSHEDDAVIIHTEYSPAVLLTCVDSVIQHPSGCGMIPVPTDSTSSIQIDMDQNGTFDFSITCSTWYQFVSASGPCANYNSSMIISGSSDSNEIALGSLYNTAKDFEFGDEIFDENSWFHISTLQLHVATAPFQTDFADEKYVGIRMISPVGYQYGWILLEKIGFKLYVKSSGIQTCPTKAIQAGQF